MDQRTESHRDALESNSEVRELKCDEPVGDLTGDRGENSRARGDDGAGDNFHFKIQQSPAVEMSQFSSHPSLPSDANTEAASLFDKQDATIKVDDYRLTDDEDEDGFGHANDIVKVDVDSIKPSRMMLAPLNLAARFVVSDTPQADDHVSPDSIKPGRTILAPLEPKRP